jgi:hypothetical protein
MASLDRWQLNAVVARRAAADPAFRKEFLANPREALGNVCELKLPRSVRLEVLEERPGTLCVVLPYPAREGAELAEADLENVAGGTIPGPLPRVASLPEPIPDVASLPGPMPDVASLLGPVMFEADLAARRLRR